MRGFILVTGSEGLVASRFVEISKLKPILHCPKQTELNITNKHQVKDLILKSNYSTVIHFAAFTDVSRAEEQRGKKDGECWQVNVEGTRNLIEATGLARGKIHFIHISTDMVFSGNQNDPGPYEEEHPIEKHLNNMTWYGFSKAQAEILVHKILGGSATILRINYPVRVGYEKKLDYLRKHLSLYDEGRLYPLFTDQYFTITSIDEASQTIDKIILGGHTGIFHAASSNVTTPHKLVSYLVREVRGTKITLEKMILAEFLKKTNTPPSRYPKFGGLKVNITEAKLGIKFSSWEKIVDKLVKQGLGQKTK